MSSIIMPLVQVGVSPEFRRLWCSGASLLDCRVLEGGGVLLSPPISLDTLPRRKTAHRADGGRRRVLRMTSRAGWADGPKLSHTDRADGGGRRDPGCRRLAHLVWMACPLDGANCEPSARMAEGDAYLDGAGWRTLARRARPSDGTDRFAH